MSLQKPKIVFIHPDLGIGGAERLVLDVAVSLSEKNTVSFVTNHFNKQHAFEELQEGQFPVRVIGSWIPRSICGIFQALFSYIRMIYLAIFYVLFVNKNEKADLFFIDQIPMAVPFIKWAGGKVIYYCHHPDLLASSPGGFMKRFYRLPINWLELKGTAMSDVILVNSQYTANVFKKTFPKITKSIYILYPTIATSYQASIENGRHNNINEISHIPNGAFVFLSINRFHPAKRLELAMDALEAAQTKLSSNEWSNVYLILAGGYDPDSNVNASYFAKLIKICENRNLMSKVTFLKSPSDTLKADLLLRCNCLLYTPVNEHFGIVPLEAMTAGKPVIACNSGGPCETVVDGVTGYLCHPTGDALADAISKVLKDDKAANMGLMGKNRLQQFFSYKTFKNRVNEIINKTLQDEDPSDNVAESKSKVLEDNRATVPESCPAQEHDESSSCGSSGQVSEHSPAKETITVSERSPVPKVEERGNSPSPVKSAEEDSSTEKKIAESPGNENSCHPTSSVIINENDDHSNSPVLEKNIQGSTNDLNVSNVSETIVDADTNKTFNIIREAGEENIAIIVSPSSTASSNDSRTIENENGETAF
ncbi:hypothetical protein RI129_002013 [Pyrocoelia pectoralis]|uniref:Alpha-1,3/1,6-mannosyltransferase ALG2 n=1 Tax=Pyrocoelia pectoralis TaxID=417401 RepID=A0AAN7VWX8_9COLE